MTLPRCTAERQSGHHDFKALEALSPLQGWTLAGIVEPVGDVLDVRRHVVAVVHAAGAGNHAARVLRDGAPSSARQDLGEALGALRADAALAPPVIHFGHVGRAVAAFDDAANAVVETGSAPAI